MSVTNDLFSAIESENSKSTIKVLFLDTETTGPDPKTAEVCEVAFLLAEYDGFTFTGEKKVFETLIKPSVPIPPEASAVNHISNKMVAELPTKEHFEKDIAKLAEQADYISAHNLPYDFTILHRQYPHIFKKFSKESFIDTLRLSRHIWKEVPSHSLQALRYRFELDENIKGEAHRALFDTELVQSLLHYSFNQTECLKLNNNWSKLVDFIASPLDVKIFGFGKYRGDLVEDVIASDPNYIKWLLRQKWLPDEQPDLYHTILRMKGDKDDK